MRCMEIYECCFGYKTDGQNTLLGLILVEFQVALDAKAFPCVVELVCDV